MSKSDGKEKGRAFISAIISATAGSTGIEGQTNANYKEFQAVVSADEDLSGKANADKPALKQSIDIGPMWATVREYRTDSAIQHLDRGYVYGKLSYRSGEEMLYIESTVPTALVVPLFDEDNPNDDAIPDWNEIPATINASGTVLAVNASGRNLPGGYRSFDLQTGSYMSFGNKNEVFTIRVIVDNGKRWKNLRFPDRGAVLAIHATLLGRDATSGYLCVSLLELDFTRFSATSKAAENTPKKAGMKNIKLPPTPRGQTRTPAKRNERVKLQAMEPVEDDAIKPAANETLDDDARSDSSKDEVDLPPADKNGDVESFVKQEEEISASNQDDDIKRKHTESDDPIKPKKKKPTVPEDPKPITRSRKPRM